MTFIITTTIFFFTVLTLVSSDYLCNCYCPTSTNYVGYATYTSSSTKCNAQNCDNACVNTFPSCFSGLAWGSCRNTATGLTVPLISLIIGLTATTIRKFI